MTTFVCDFRFSFLPFTQAHTRNMRSSSKGTTKKGKGTCCGAFPLFSFAVPSSLITVFPWETIFHRICRLRSNPIIEIHGCAHVRLGRWFIPVVGMTASDVTAPASVDTGTEGRWKRSPNATKASQGKYACVTTEKI